MKWWLTAAGDLYVHAGCGLRAQPGDTLVPLLRTTTWTSVLRCWEPKIPARICRTTSATSGSGRPTSRSVTWPQYLPFCTPTYAIRTWKSSFRVSCTCDIKSCSGFRLVILEHCHMVSYFGDVVCAGVYSGICSCMLHLLLALLFHVNS